MPIRCNKDGSIEFDNYADFNQYHRSLVMTPKVVAKLNRNPPVTKKRATKRAKKLPKSGESWASKHDDSPKPKTIVIGSVDYVKCRVYVEKILNNKKRICRKSISFHNLFLNYKFLK